jgi:hypothetical protein
MPDGIIIVDKPQDWTSMDVCAKLRRVMGERRVGHAGTLDPLATGVLPVFVGRATRAVEFASESNKEYIADIKLGVITDTQDRTGTVLETRPVTAGRTEVEAALAAPGVIKNRSKARCAVTNARAFLAVAEEWGSFARYLWHWVDGVPVDHRLERPEDMPAEDDLSRRVSADLKKRGFRFVGPVIVYSYLQGAGLINDHLVTCPWHGEGL